MLLFGARSGPFFMLSLQAQHGGLAVREGQLRRPPEHVARDGGGLARASVTWLGRPAASNWVVREPISGLVSCEATPFKSVAVVTASRAS